MTNPEAPNVPPMRAALSVTDGVAVLVGVVIGVGIFGFPPLVAQQTDSGWIYMGLWLAGSLVMLVGALCYAELGSSYPSAGGEYHFLERAWGSSVGLLFAWARGTVIQTGSIAAVAFIYGEYAQQLLPLGALGAAWHAALAVALLTALNILGTRESKRMQLLFTSMTVIAIASVVLAGLFSTSVELPIGLVAEASTASGSGAAAVDGAGTSPAGQSIGALGMAMVFVLLTFGGWNEAAYLSGELKNPQRSMSRVLLLGTVIITLLYLLINLAYLQIFGLEGLRQTESVGAELIRIVVGPYASLAMSLLVCITALSTMNATILTGARVYYALGRDIPQLQMLGAWNERGSTPSRALLLQGLITLALILFGALSGDGLRAMVAYTAPVFWLFMLLTAASLLVLRRRDEHRYRPFQVPWYPFTPILFVLTCLGLLWSSTVYAGVGAVVGLMVLVAGWPLLRLRRNALQP